MSKEPLILNLETSTDTCSVCLSKGHAVLELQASTQPYEHAKVLTLLIDQCCAAAGCQLQEIDAVAISTGPGSYTSLRVGASTAKGICFALDKPLIKVDTLRALALATQRLHKLPDAFYCPMIDARRMEVYCCVFDGQNNPVTKTTAMVVEKSSFEEFFASGKKVIFSGNGAEKCREVLTSDKAIFLPLTCSAAHLPSFAVTAFTAADFTSTADFVPTYLKPPNITIPKKMSVLERARRSR